MKRITKLLLVSLGSFFGISLATSQTAPSEIAHAAEYEANWGTHELVQQADYELRDGATESQFISYGPSAQGQNWYSRSVANFYDLSKVTVLTSYKNYDTLLQNGTYSSSTVQEQINYLVDNMGYDVLGGINGTSFDTSNGAPNMGLMINGVEYCPGYYFSDGFFGIVKNEEGHQKAVIGRADEYAGFRDGTVTLREENGVQVDYTGYKLWQAIGAWYDAMLVYNGELCPTDTWDEEHPRTAIGITAEGNVVTYVCEGRNGNRAGGLSLYNMATIMKDLGCVFAVNLDGGGSSTALSKHAGETTYKNRIEAAYGADRSVGDAVIFVSTESMSSEPVEHDNTFAKAHILPNNDLFVVGTTINFTATGSNAYGDPVDLPQDVVWELDVEKSTPNIGTIDPATGVFTANGTTSGNVYVNLKYNGVVVGSTKVDLTWPSWNYSNAFATNFTLGYNETKTLEFTLYPDAGEGNKALGISTWRPIVLQECDLEWNLPIGCSMTQNQDGDFVFKAGDVPVVNGEVSVKQIKATGQTNVMTKKAIVSIGKAPDIIYDFEDTEWIKDFGTGGTGTSIYRTTKSDGGKVLFGDAALAIDYDFSDRNYIPNLDPNKGNNPSVTFYNANIALNPVVPAEAKYFGMWAFFPEGLDGCWFRVTLQGVNGSTATTTMTDFVSMPANPKVDRGIYGSGEWRFYYTEVGFDTRYGTAWSGMEGPYSIYSCQMMWSAFADTGLGYDYNQPSGNTPDEIAASKEAAKLKIEENFNKACRGTIYIDNIIALYGNPSSDMLNPYFSKINSTKESDNTYTLSFNVNDEDRYNADEVVGIKYGDSCSLSELQSVTGINYSTLEVYLNGTLLAADKYTLDQTTGLVTIPGLTELTAGTTIRVVAYDNYYNKLDRTSTLHSIEYISGEEGNEEKVTQLYWDRDTIVAPTPANKTGYTFSKWEYSNPVHSSMMPDTNVVVNATYTINQYTLKFEYDGQVISETSVDYNSDIVVPSLDGYSKVGYTFTGWDVTVPEKMPANDLTIKAVFEINKHNVTINDQDGNLIVRHENVEYGSTIALPTIEGYTLTWATGTNTTMPDSDVTLVVNKLADKDYVNSFITAIKNAKTVDDKFVAFKQAEEVLGSYSDTEKQSISDLVSEFEALKADYNNVVNNAKTDLNEARKITSWIVSGIVASAVALLAFALKRRIF